MSQKALGAIEVSFQRKAEQSLSPEIFSNPCAHDSAHVLLLAPCIGVPGKQQTCFTSFELGPVRRFRLLPLPSSLISDLIQYLFFLHLPYTCMKWRSCSSTLRNSDEMLSPQNVRHTMPQKWTA